MTEIEKTNGNGKIDKTEELSPEETKQILAQILANQEEIKELLHRQRPRGGTS